MTGPQPFGEQVQPCIPAALGLDLGDRRDDVIEVCPGSAMSLAYQMELALEIEAPGILRVAAIDHVEECSDLPGRVGGERDPPHGFAIDHGDLLARAQVFDCCVAPVGRDPIGDAAAGAAEVEAEHEAGPLGRAAMDEGVHAQPPVQAGQSRRDAFQMRESGPPHQRAVAEYPEVFVGGSGKNRHWGRKWHLH